MHLPGRRVSCAQCASTRTGYQRKTWTPAFIYDISERWRGDMALIQQGPCDLCINVVQRNRPERSPRDICMNYGRINSSRDCYHNSHGCMVSAELQGRSGLFRMGGPFVMLNFILSFFVCARSTFLVVTQCASRSLSQLRTDAVTALMHIISENLQRFAHKRNHINERNYFVCGCARRRFTSVNIKLLIRF